MSDTTLILTDVVLVITLVMIYTTDGFQQYPLILGPLVVIALATTIVRHINHYKHTKRIY